MKVAIVPNPFTFSQIVKSYSISKALLRNYPKIKIMVSVSNQTIWNPLPKPHSPPEIFSDLNVKLHIFNSGNYKKGYLYGEEIKKQANAIIKFKPNCFVTIAYPYMCYVKDFIKNSKCFIVSHVLDHENALERSRPYFNVADRLIFMVTKNWARLQKNMRDFESKSDYVGPILRVKRDELPSKEKIRDELKIDQDSFVILSIGYGKSVIIGYEAKSIPEIASEATSILKKYISKITFISIGGNGSMKKIKGVDNRYIGFTFDYIKYMRAADVIITKPGYQTLCESIVAETPSIIWVPKLDFEARINSQNMKKVKASIPIEDDKFNKKNVAEAILKVKEKKMNTKKAYRLYMNKERGADLTSNIIWNYGG
ncbi:MAG: glycosyltransferase [Candidatus Heimdallarchaeota archaeon]